ncbi:MAG: hypothetical protein SF187_21395 [Deltaproteobacteria bacterium]|nr:hypothetical protein [Deltaproteobacteria bacterium]
MNAHKTLALFTVSAFSAAAVLLGCDDDKSPAARGPDAAADAAVTMATDAAVGDAAQVPDAAQADPLACMRAAQGFKACNPSAAATAVAEFEAACQQQLTKAALPSVNPALRPALERCYLATPPRLICEALKESESGGALIEGCSYIALADVLDGKYANAAEIGACFNSAEPDACANPPWYGAVKTCVDKVRACGETEPDFRLVDESCWFLAGYLQPAFLPEFEACARKDCGELPACMNGVQAQRLPPDVY